MKCYAGIDIGSTSIKLALLDEAGQILATLVRPSGGNYHKNAQEGLAELLAQAGAQREELEYIVSTGYGRKLFKEADEAISEITANALGIKALGPDFAGVRTIINIGGQDLKVISLDETGNMSNFVMNDKCAAGTGRFLEMVAVNLETELEELGNLHQACDTAPVTINSTCTVFADSEIIGLLAKGHSKEEIVQGVHFSIAKRILRLANRVGLKGDVLFDGGPALNQGLVAAMELELMKSLKIPPQPQLTTALGAASLAREAAHA